MGSWRRLLDWIVIGFILLFGLLMLVLTLGHHLQMGEARTLVESGTETQAVVTQMHGGRRNMRSYSYRFKAAGQEVHAAKRDIPYGMRDEFAPGDTIRVWYDPSDPARKNMTMAELHEMESWWNRLAPAVLGGGLIFLAARLMRRKPQRR